MFINRDNVSDPVNTFVLPLFVKPGRTHFVLRTPIDKATKERVDAG